MNKEYVVINLLPVPGAMRDAPLVRKALDEAKRVIRCSSFLGYLFMSCNAFTDIGTIYRMRRCLAKDFCSRTELIAAVSSSFQRFSPLHERKEKAL